MAIVNKIFPKCNLIIQKKDKMYLNLNSKTSYRTHYCSWKYCFASLLVINTLIGCIYYVNDEKTSDLLTSSARIRNFSSTCPIEIIAQKLSNEYNHEDLDRFYSHVKQSNTFDFNCQRNRTSTSRSSSKPISKFHKFILEHSDACTNQSIDLVIIIISKSENYKTRDAIRRTWASNLNFRRYSSLNIKYFFLIDFDENLAQSIQLENDLFDDIIQVELPQQYTLVTHRVVSIFEWVFRYCYSAKYFFKSDDDIFFNLILLTKFLSTIIDQTTSNSFTSSDFLIYGYRHEHARVFRHSSNLVLSRYAITYDEYPCTHFPTYLSGYGYLISRKARDAFLYTIYHDHRPFRISDVYLTGIIPEYLSISPLSMSNYIIADRHCERFFNQSNALACASDSHRGGKLDLFQKYNNLWETIKRTHGY